MRVTVPQVRKYSKKPEKLTLAWAQIPIDWGVVKNFKRINNRVNCSDCGRLASQSHCLPCNPSHQCIRQKTATGVRMS